VNEHGNQVAAGNGLRDHAVHFGSKLSANAAAALRSPASQHVVMLLILPILLVWINYTVIFVKPIGIDTFLYSGFHLHLREFLSSRFADTYYATRIPWNALGYVAHRLFDTEHAIYAEHIFIFYVAAFSLYSAVSTIFANRSAAFAATMLLGTNCWFLLAIGWDYVDGSYVACLLLSLAMMAKAAFGPRWKLAATIWGVAVALTISLYILWVILVPIEIGMFLGLNRLGQRRKVYVIALLWIFGAATAMACMGLISWLAGGKFLYLLPQITAVPFVVSNRFNYDVPLSRWLWQAEHLLVPGAIWLFSAVWAVQNARSTLRKLQSPESEVDVNSRLWIACVFCVAGFLLFLPLQVADIHLFNYQDKTNALLPFEFLVLGGTLASGRSELFQRHQWIYTLTIIAVTLAPWVAFAFRLKAPDYGLIAPRWEYFTGPTATICWIAAGALVLWISLVSGQLKYLLVTSFFSVVAFGGGDSGWISFPPNPFYKQARLAIFEASQEIAPYNSDTAARFWFDVKDPISQVLRDVVSTYLAAYSLINDRFPSLTGGDGRVSSIAPGERVIILTSSSADPLPAANRAIADKKLAFRKVASKEIHRKGVTIRFFVVDAVPKANTGSAVVARPGISASNMKK
jgi:hypothetical protein